MTARYDRVVALVLVTLALAGFFAVRDVGLAAGLYPRLVLGLLGVLSTLLFVRSFLRPSEAAQDSFLVHPTRFLIGTASTLAYMLAVDYLGFYPATALFFPIVAVLLGYRNFAAVTLTTAIYLGAIYGLLAGVFGQVMPRGVFGD